MGDIEKVRGRRYLDIGRRIRCLELDVSINNYLKNQGKYLIAFIIKGYALAHYSYFVFLYLVINVTVAENPAM